MLTKLLKYDFKATGRIILPIAGGVLLLNFVSDLLGHFVNNTGHTMPWVGVFMGLLTLATFLGMLAVLAMCVVPFLQLGIHYLAYKAAAALSATVSGGRVAGLIDQLGGAFGLVLGMTGSCALLLLISLVSAITAVVR